MNGRISGRLFLSITVIYIAVELLLSFTPLLDGLDVIGSMIISELIIIVPSLAAFYFSRERFTDVFAIRGIRPVLIPLCILFTVLVLPLCSCLNLVTLFFVENQAAGIFDSLSEAGMGLMAFFAAVAAPVFEELTFRGVIFSGIRKSGSAVQAIVWSAVLFGLFHMNLNQMCYAIALGIFFGALREVTGSIIPSIICHMTINGSSTIVMILQSGGGDPAQEGASLQKMTSQVLTTDILVQALAIYIVLAFVGAAVALCVLALIARKQGGLVRMQEILSQRKATRGHVAGPELIAGVVLCSLMISFVLVWKWIGPAIMAAS